MPHTASVFFNRLLARGKFRHAQVLLRLAELGSVQRTAEALGMTQSAVTQALAYLERLLETRLFERHARGVRPTPVCQDLLPVARTLLRGLGDGADALAARASAREGQVRLAASAAALNGLLLQALPAFSARHPTISVLLREAEDEEQLLLVSKEEVDVVACRRPAVIPEGWRFQPLRTDRFAILCAPRHPLAGRRDAGWGELAGETWLLSPAGSAARTRFDALTQGQPGIASHPLITRSLAMTWWMLRHGNALGFIPLSLARHLLDGGELAEIMVREPGDLALAPLGILAPLAQQDGAASRLCGFVSGMLAASALGPVATPAA